MLNESKQSSEHDLEEDRLLAEKLQREEEAEYAEFNKMGNVDSDFVHDSNGIPLFSPPNGKSTTDPKNFNVNLPSTSKDNKYQKLHVQHKNLTLIDPVWEQIDPTPDIHALFIAFDNRFFAGYLKSCEVRWSPRMTLCAGLCCFQPRSRFCSIRLSKPLLSLRPRSDLVETLLHEMIHAFLFLTNNNRDRDGHGPEFHKHMYRINKEAGTKISVYHSFHDEVRHFKVHHWRCTGPCKDRAPYFGWVKRSMNRAPGKNDFWWADHQRTCGGDYIKVSEPEKPIKEPKTKQSQNTTGAAKPPSPLRKFFKTDGGSSTSPQPGPSGIGGGAGGTRSENGRTKPGLAGNSSTSGQSTSGTGKAGSIRRPDQQPNITTWLPKPRADTTPPGSVNGSFANGASTASARPSGGRPLTPRGRVSTPANNPRARVIPTSNPARPSLGTQNPSPANGSQHPSNINRLPAVRGGAGSGSRVFTIKGPTRTSDHVLPTSQTNAPPSIFAPNLRMFSPNRVFRPFQGTGNVLGGAASASRLVSTQTPNARPQSSLLDKLSKNVEKPKPSPTRKRTKQELLDIFSSDEDEIQEEQKRVKIETEAVKQEPKPVKPEVKQEKGRSNPLKREFEDEASTSQRPPKSAKREPKNEASTSRRGSSSQEVIVIPDNDVEVVCPVCSSKVPESTINSHIDECLK